MINFKYSLYSDSGILDNDFNNWIEYIYSNKFNRMKKHSAVNIFKVLMGRSVARCP